MNKTDEVEIIGHARQLATDCLQGEKEATVQHARENELGGAMLENQFSANA